jgi:hypothetical protein
VSFGRNSLSPDLIEQLVLRLQPIIQSRTIAATTRYVDFVGPALNDLDIDGRPPVN